MKSETEDELDLTGKDDAKKTTSKRPGRPSRETKAQSLRSDLQESIVEIADWLDRRKREQPVDADDLAAVIRAKAGEMADVLAALAEKSDVAAKVLGRLVGRGGPLSALRAFGPIVRHLLTIVFQARAAQLDEDEETRPDAAGYGLT